MLGDYTPKVLHFVKIRLGVKCLQRSNGLAYRVETWNFYNYSMKKVLYISATVGKIRECYSQTFLRSSYNNFFCWLTMRVEVTC